MKKFRSLILVGFLFVAVGAYARGAGLESVRKDLNGDGYKEAEVFYSSGKVVKTVLDMNGDRVADSTIRYKNGYRDRAEGDKNGDGRVDVWVDYYFTGVPWKVAEDLNGDGKADYWFYLKDGKIYKWEQDRDADGRADVKTTYSLDPSGKKRTLVQQSYDDDFDGVYDAASGITMARRETGMPHSLAEALLR